MEKQNLFTEALVRTSASLDISAEQMKAAKQDHL